MIALLLTAWLFTPQQGGAARPVFLSGDMRTDWTNHATTASVCVVDEMPAKHILVSWRKLGVKMLKRVAWDPGCSPEYVRRKAGFLAVKEGADGVWLADASKFSSEWNTAIAEAGVDADIALYCKSLAEKAMTYREKDNKVWIEGRRVLWFFRFMDIDTENLDTIRLEFVAYARWLEQLMNLPPRKLPTTLGSPVSADRAPYEPLADKKVNAKQVKLADKTPIELAEGVMFSNDRNGFSLEVVSKRQFTGYVPGGKGSIRLFLADGKGSYLPYEFKIDFTPVATNRAPTDAQGLWFLEERWGKGVQKLYGDPKNWRFRTVAYGSYGSHYPAISPRFDYKRKDDGSEWSLKLDFSWLSAWGFWPSVKDGAFDKWFIAVEGLPGVPDASCRIDWRKGSEENRTLLADCLAKQQVKDRYERQISKEGGKYGTAHGDRLYDFAKPKEPVFCRFDRESNEIFNKRILKPMSEVAQRRAKRIPQSFAKLTPGKTDDALKTLDELFRYSERVSEARRDYLLMRFAGEMPPEPKEEPKKAEPNGPNADAGEDALTLDEED